MSRIRIAQTGWAFDRPARSVDEVNAGFGLWWVEIDGVRVRSILRATVEAVKLGEGPDGEPVPMPITSPKLTLEILGPVEIVYVDETGEPLPASERVEVDAHLLPPEIVAGTALIRPRRNS